MRFHIGFAVIVHEEAIEAEIFTFVTVEAENTARVTSARVY